MENPVSLFDPDGKRVGDYYDQFGNWLYSDKLDDQRVYRVSTLPPVSSDIPGGPNTPLIQYIGQVKDVFTTGDPVSDSRIQNLHPAIRMKATNFIKTANEGSSGTKIRVAQGFRTFSEQDALYAKGRTTDGPKVTNAQGGFSNHNFGLAFDIVGITNDKVDYNLDWNKLSELGKSFGFEWGGDWKTIVDKPHFENLFGVDLGALRERQESGNKTSSGYVGL
jgi:hypothetical protein